MQRSTENTMALATDDFFESSLRYGIFPLVALDKVLKALSYNEFNLANLQ